MSDHYLEPMFAPRSVALVGATERADKVGGRVLRNLLDAGYTGELCAVNPKYERIGSVPCVPSVDRLPHPVDLAVVVTPAPTVPDIIERCGVKGIPAAVVISAGFSETGPEGERLERELLASARRHGVRVLGPNCIGIMRPPLGLDATFGRGSAHPGALALIAQSGAVCTVMIDWAAAHGVGFSSVVSLGGSADVDFGEAIDYFASDPQTGHILLYIEGVRDGRRLVGSLRAAARTKPVILMKVGRHPSGSRAAVSHTGAIVGRDDVFDAVVHRTGAVRVRALADLVAAAQALASHVRPSGGRLAVITNGGGPGVIAADRAADLGVELATLAPETVATLQGALPSNWSHGNPVDLIGDADAGRYRMAVSACLADPGIDGLVVILAPQAVTRAEDAADAVAEAAHGASKPVLAAWMGEGSVVEARERLQAAGIPEFRGPERAVETFAQIAQFYRNQRTLLEAPGPLAHREPPDLAAAHELVQAALDAGRDRLSDREAKALLAAFRVPVNRAIAAAGVEETVRAANEVGYPVAIKIDSPDIAHKSDVGGVRLQLADEAAVRAAHAEMMRTAAERRPEARITGVMVEAMVSRPHGRELMAGFVCDPIFGPALAFGAGGIAVEVLHDRVVALPPLNAALAADMVRGTRIGAMLGEFRNLPAVDRAALDAVLLRVSEMACEVPEMEELDINPLIADESGVIAVDARVVLRARPAQRTRYAHLVIHPYPRELERRLSLPGGVEVTLRPIRPEDAGMEEVFVSGLSERSRRMRFLSALRTLSPGMLARFTQIDYDREMALVAVQEEAGRESELAVCRYVTLPDGRTCEFAIVVADAWQRHGLGRRMMSALIEVAAARGLERMVGLVHASNAPMLRLCKELGFVPEAHEEPHTRRLVLALGAPVSGTRAPAPVSG